MHQMQSQPSSAASNREISDEVAQSFRRTVETLNKSGNVTRALTAFASMNPQFKAVLETYGNMDPRQIFFNECKRRGIDPSKAAAKMGLQ